MWCDVVPEYPIDQMLSPLSSVYQRPRSPNLPPIPAPASPRVRPFGRSKIIARTLRPFAITGPISHPAHASAPFDLVLFFFWWDEAMHSPMVHDSAFIIVLTRFFCLGPLVPVELAMTLASGAFFAGLVAIGLNPASVAGAAVDPSRMAFAKEETGTNVITWAAVGGNFEFNRWLNNTEFSGRARYWLWLCHSGFVWLSSITRTPVFWWSAPSFRHTFGDDSEIIIIDFGNRCEGRERRRERT